jgi:uncharacterized membrane protein (UPF0127 family)/CheY-like chemotaxis protein
VGFSARWRETCGDNGRGSHHERPTGRPITILNHNAIAIQGRPRDSVTETKLIVDLTIGRCLCVGELVDRPLRRMRGLIGREGLAAGEGLLLRPGPAIHTAFMGFPIDALFLDRRMRVLEIVERLRPWRVASNRRARAVLELSAGECARCGVRVGDQLELRDRVGRGAARPEARLQPLRVLVLSEDRHFRTVMSMLLARRNCSVTTTANPATLGELIVRERAEVAVIDAGEPPAAGAVATVQTLAQPVGLVLVSEEGQDVRPEPPALPKWGPFEELLEAIEAAGVRHVGGGPNGR